MNERSFEAAGGLAPRLYEYVLAGLVLTIGAGAATAYHVYHGFVTESMAREQAYWGIGLPFVGVVSGVFLFAFGWQRGDIERAVRMSMWLTLGAIGVLVAVLGVLSLKRSGSARRALLRFGQPERPQRQGWHFGEHGDEEPEAPAPPQVWGSASWGTGDELTRHCRHCGEMFVPQPPRALCPSCGTSTFSRTG
jgi:hypothetical protein